MLRRLAVNLARLCLATVPLLSQADTEIDTLRANALEFLRTTDLPQAEEALWRILERHPRDAEAWLDLGLLYCEKGWPAAAEKIFDRLKSEFSPPQHIVALIEDTQQYRCGQHNPPWQTYWHIAAGHDSNLNLGLMHDRITLFDAAGAFELTLAPESRPKPGPWLSQEFGLGAQLGKTALTGRLGMQQSTLGRDEDRYLLQLGVGRNWGSAQHSLQAQYNGRGNDTELLRLSWQGRFPLGSQHLETDFSWNRLVMARQNDYALAETRLTKTWRITPAQNLSSSIGLAYSQPGHADNPGGARHGSTANLQWMQEQGIWRIRADHAWQNWRDSETYSPVLGELKRNQNLQQTRVEISREMNNHWRCGLTWQHLRSDDAVPLFDYQQQRYGLQCERN